MASQVEKRLKEHEIVLPTPPAAVASYVPFLKSQQLVVISGQLPIKGGDVLFTGKVGKDLPEAAGAKAARLCAINCLAQLKACVGNLDLVTRILRLEGYVQSAPGFTFQPLVLNGASEIMTLAFGEAGRHTRIAVGVAELPMNAAVEVSMWAEVATELPTAQ